MHSIRTRSQKRTPKLRLIASEDPHPSLFYDASLVPFSCLIRDLTVRKSPVKGKGRHTTKRLHPEPLQRTGTSQGIRLPKGNPKETLSTRLSTLGKTRSWANNLESSLNSTHFRKGAEPRDNQREPTKVVRQARSMVSRGFPAFQISGGLHLSNISC